jgi:ankyrin repeat protein
MKLMVGGPRWLATGALCIVLSVTGCGGKKAKDPETQRQQDVAAAFDAAAAGRRARVENLLDGGVAVDSRNGAGRTLLHVAASHGHDELVQSLIARGSQVGAADPNGDTPLHLAAAAGHDGTVRTLLSAGASKTAQNKAGKTPADVATSRVKDRLL